MPHSAIWTASPKNVRKVLALYRSEENLSASKIAGLLGTQIHNVTFILKNQMSGEEYRRLKALRWSIAKRGDRHPRWEPDRDQVQRKRTVHMQKGDRNYRQTMAGLLGLPRLPSHVDVHHIDGDTSNDNLDNLILLTPEAHMRLHRMFGFKIKRRRIINNGGDQ